ncbi:MAG: hypothetical protein LBS50_09400 [Prevotellaceae bacterium]|nr:hypothetical protein [Prevotellaceae bacterium]
MAKSGVLTAVLVSTTLNHPVLSMFYAPDIDTWVFHSFFIILNIVESYI